MFNLFKRKCTKISREDTQDVADKALASSEKLIQKARSLNKQLVQLDTAGEASISNFVRELRGSGHK